MNPLPDNAVRLFRGLARFGAPMGDSASEVFITPGVVFQVGVVPSRIDILTSISGGISFGEAVGNSLVVDVDGAEGSCVAAGSSRSKEASYLKSQRH